VATKPDGRRELHRQSPRSESNAANPPTQRGAAEPLPQATTAPLLERAVLALNLAIPLPAARLANRRPISSARSHANPPPSGCRETRPGWPCRCRRACAEGRSPGCRSRRGEQQDSTSGLLVDRQPSGLPMAVGVLATRVGAESPIRTRGREGFLTDTADERYSVTPRCKLVL
jgi:hypothetical protein